MTENELEKEVIEICKKPRKERGVYRQVKKKFSGMDRKKFHELFLKMIYRGSLEVTLDWKIQIPGKNLLNENHA